MQAIRGQAQNAIPYLHIFAADDVLAFNHSHNESGKIVFALGIEPRHFGSLAANQSAAVVLAGFSQSAHDFFHHFRIQFAGGQIVHEKQRGRALHRDGVIHAMIHQIAADAV